MSKQRKKSPILARKKEKTNRKAIIWAGAALLAIVITMTVLIIVN